MYIFAQVGVKLPHGATSQLSYGASVSRSELQPGDLVFFQDYGAVASHVGIYIGGDQFIHASSSSGQRPVRDRLLAGGELLRQPLLHRPAALKVHKISRYTSGKFFAQSRETFAGTAWSYSEAGGEEMTDFEEVYAPYFDSVYRYVLSLCRDVHTAEEITQESFCRAMTHLDRFDGRCRLYVWLCQIAKNTYLTHAKGRNDAAPRRRTSSPIRALRASCWSVRRRGSCTDSCIDLDEPYQEVFSPAGVGRAVVFPDRSAVRQVGQLGAVVFYRAKTELRRRADENRPVTLFRIFCRCTATTRAAARAAIW